MSFDTNGIFIFDKKNIDGFTFAKLTEEDKKLVTEIHVKHIAKLTSLDLNNFPNLTEIYLENLVSLEILTIENAPLLSKLKLGNLVQVTAFKASKTPKFNILNLGNKHPKKERFATFTVEGQNYIDKTQESTPGKELIIEFRKL